MATEKALAKWLGVAVALALAKGASADYVTLKKSDKDGSTAVGASSYTSSFLVNSPLADQGYGWLDGGDPDPDKEYLLDVNKTLFTPYGTGSATYTFPGRSLTLDNGTLGNRSCTDSGASTVCVSNLIFKQGNVGNYGWARNNVWDGVFTFDGSGHGHDYSKIRFSINLRIATINAKLIASAAENVQLYGQTMSAEINGDYYWVKNPYLYRFAFCGDCTEYLATNHLYWSSAAHVETADFAGSFFLGNVGRLTIGSGVSAVRIGGSVKSRDGWIDVPQDKTMDVRGGLDFAFADSSTYVFKGTNVYTRELSTQPYSNTNGVARQPQISLNAITVASGATLSTPSAALSGTLVNIASGATLTIGDASLDGVILAIDGSGRLELTNSLAVSAPVKLRLGGAGVTKALVTLPVGKGELDPGDFTFEDAPQFRYRLAVVTVGGVQTLWATDINPAVKDATTGYVVLTNADGNSEKTFTVGSYNQGGNWSEAGPPHPGTNYFTNGKWIRDKSATTKTFQGDSLTQSGVFRLGRTSFEIKDWRVLSSGRTVMTDRTQITTSGNTGVTYTFEGLLTVFATDASPFMLWGGKSTYSGEEVTSRQTYVMKTKIVGAADSAIAAEGVNSLAPGALNGQAACNFVGDMTEFYGTLSIGTNQTVRLGDTGIPNGTVVLRTAYSTLTTLATNNADVAVGTLRTTWPSTVTVPATNTLSVGALDVVGTLAKNGEGVFAAGGTATAGAGAAISVTAGGLRAGSKDAFNGIPLSFAAGTSLTLPLATSDADFAKYGLYDSAGVTAAGTLNVVLDATGVEEPSELSRGVLTVPTSAAGGILEKLKASSPWRGFRVSFGSATEGDMTIFTATIWKTGFTLIFK